MDWRRLIAAVGLGLVVFLVVGVVTTQLLLDVVWPSLFVGIPVGAAAGLVAGVIAWYRLGP
ncbi:hypothetical protein HSRCO_2305 [Halanaeroarchaeum sp. HSR-CO]|uniref:hypothetical protein n=1 Tax=Halanaeroarchaeum sp. HSR-CO TaxID=2866382 RepID=UPI00217E82B8|nr:hypothetical protein [Halanaeroarchaeum sp. HSR-CO]UWG48573.1 hypothetical protein HSRCO_2305 [Halanaeroarchaeum sp. HSR-CO]